MSIFYLTPEQLAMPTIEGIERPSPEQSPAAARQQELPRSRRVHRVLSQRPGLVDRTGIPAAMPALPPPEWYTVAPAVSPASLQDTDAEPVVTNRNAFSPALALPTRFNEPHPGARLRTPAEAPACPSAQPLLQGAAGFPFPATPSAGPSTQPSSPNPTPRNLFTGSNVPQRSAEGPTTNITAESSNTAQQPLAVTAVSSATSYGHNVTSGDPDTYCVYCIKLLPTPESPNKLTYLLVPDVVAFGITQKYAVGCTHKFHISCFMDYIKHSLSKGERYSCPVCHFSLLDPEGKVCGKIYVIEVGSEGNIVVPRVPTHQPDNAVMTREPDYIVFDFSKTIEQFETFYSNKTQNRARKLQWLTLFDRKLTPETYSEAEKMLCGRGKKGEELRKMDVNVRHPLGNLTALHIAALRDDPVAVGLLLKYKAKKNLRTGMNGMTAAGIYGNNGMTALEVAKACGSKKALEALGVNPLSHDKGRGRGSERPREERRGHQVPGRRMEQMEMDGAGQERRGREWIFSDRVTDCCICLARDDCAGQIWDILNWFYRHLNRLFWRLVWLVRRHLSL